MSDQENYGRFTPSAWNVIKNVNLNDEEREKLNHLISIRTETITENELKAMLYTVVHQKI